MEETPLILGIIALAAVWLWSNAKVAAASIASNPFSPSGINAAGNAVGAGGVGIAALIQSIGNLSGGSNSGGGPLGGQSSDTGGGMGSGMGIGAFGNPDYSSNPMDNVGNMGSSDTSYSDQQLV